jgi:hypothetical protein
MKIISTKYGNLPMAESRSELDSWSMDEALAWLALNDPNGEWHSYIENFRWAECEFGELSLDDVLDQVWEQMREA